MNPVVFDSSAMVVALNAELGSESLDYRACLALGISLGAPVYTADKSWKQLKLPIRIHVIR